MYMNLVEDFFFKGNFIGNINSCYSVVIDYDLFGSSIVRICIC